LSLIQRALAQAMGDFIGGHAAGRLLLLIGVALGCGAQASQLDFFDPTTSPIESNVPGSIRPAIPFAVYLPTGYSDSVQYPVIVYLHGKGGSYDGNNATYQKPMRDSYDAARNANKIGPAILVIPDGYGKPFLPGYPTTVETGWSNSNSLAALNIPNEEDVWQVIEYVDLHYSTRGDTARAIIGHSMGGSASAKFAAKYPERFLAWVGFDAPLNKWDSGNVSVEHYYDEAYFDQAGNPWYWINPATVANAGTGLNVAKIIAHRTRFRQVESSSVGINNPEFRALLISDGITEFPAVGAGTPNEEYKYVGMPHGNVAAIFAADGTASWEFLQAAFVASTYPVVEIVSTASEDGHVLESGVGTGQGGTVNSNSPNLIVGDTAGQQAYRSVLSFHLVPPVAGAIVESAVLKLTRTVGAGLVLGTLSGAVKAGSLGTGVGVDSADWADPSTAVGFYPVFIPETSGEGTAARLTAAGMTAVNAGLAVGVNLVQVRLAYDLGSNGNSTADTRGFASANHQNTNYRPVLSVRYRLP
jgi:S-formylglutathione hydrolase FrmB